MAGVNADLLDPVLLDFRDRRATQKERFGGELFQRWEATRYAGISLDRIHAVAEALGVKIREKVILPNSGRRLGSDSLER